MNKPLTITGEVRELAVSLGFHIVPGNRPFIYGPLDSLAILLDMLLCKNEQECSEALKLLVLAKSIAETPFCASSTKSVDAGQKL